MHFLHCSAKEGSNCRNLLTFFFFDVTNFPSLLRCHQPTRLLAQTNSWLRAGSLANTNNLVATDATSPESSVVVFFSLSLSLSLPFCLLFSFPFTLFPGILFHLAFFFFPFFVNAHLEHKASNGKTKTSSEKASRSYINL